MKNITRSLKSFIQLETTSSVILIVVSVIGLIWANSAFGDSYQEFWNHKFTIGFADTNYHLSKPLILWINDGLMAVFFFVIGLEIKREVFVGELTTLRKASLPIFAAVGGMLFPVIIFLLLNNGKEGIEGWGIPMATDIAFTLGVLKLLGKRVPVGLKIFLTAFAIIDDIGAVLVIAVFYSAGIQWSLIGISILLILLLAILNYKKYYSKYFYLTIGFIVWLLFLKSGVHPTIAGVLMAFTIPIRGNTNVKAYLRKMNTQLTAYKENKQENAQLLSKAQIQAIDNVAVINSKAHSPLQQLEHGLHGWVSYLIMPIFALANAGVVIDFSLNSGMSYVTLNLALALVVGNVIGITLMSYLGIKLKLADLPKGVSFKQIFGISLLGGLGFTMSLFIVNLAYTDQNLIAQSKIGVIIGSLAAGILGYIVLKSTLRKKS